MKTIMYLHGYGSTGQAVKARLLGQMFPSCRLIAPTFDYDAAPPADLFARLRALLAEQRPSLLVGSSMGGYFALCCTPYYSGTVWCVNPVCKVEKTIAAVFPGPSAAVAERLAQYGDFDRRMFQALRPEGGRLNFALSTDDELLGDHSRLMRLFPRHNAVVWKEHCGHRFMRFAELGGPIRKSLGWSE